jgi:hypothetical protein
MKCLRSLFFCSFPRVGKNMLMGALAEHLSWICLLKSMGPFELENI